MDFNFQKWNKLTGWFIFLIATLVYLLTIEDTASLWDCGEYITAAYKLEVGHPPGAPFFMILGRLFSFFADPEYVAICINALSALSSSFTILFMFWSLSLFIRKIISMKKETLEHGDKIIVLIASAIGSLAYTFSDSFWFSAVEGEVYAMASLFTAVIFWAILKWDEEMGLVQKGEILRVSPNRWLLLIMFLLGLAIGVHLLGILVVPSIGYIIYFRLAKNVNTKGILLTGLISIATLGFIQKGVIPGSIAMASAFEVYFVNSLGMSFYTGSIVFFSLLIYGLFLLIKYARKNNKGILYNASMGLVFLLIGYGSFAVIVIRSNANTPLDENDPENLVTLRSYLEREQYGYTPLLSGPYWNSQENDRSEWESANPTYIRRFVVVKDGKDIKAFTNEQEANAYSDRVIGTVEEKYFASNKTVASDGRVFYQPMRPTYQEGQTTIFPRMYSDDPKHIRGYVKWSGYDPDKNSSAVKGKDGKRLPTFGENLTYFFKYQVNWMYFRYFMWNFAGRQNDIQGHGDQMRGNWISGIPFLDNMRLGDQSNAPFYTIENPSNNKFFLLPLILALVGLFFHFYRAPKDAFVLLLTFIFTGLAIVVYLNQKPIEPRERDYAYAGSFYFFAMWIGIGVYAIYSFFHEKRYLKNDLLNAGLTGAVCLSVPLIMAIEGWDDHDRSGKTTARDLALNYLESCSKNGILFTNGDNDTFPLWYMQEVEGKRTDVRVCNLSLMGTDWYTNQMKMKAYDSDPLPIKFREDQILMLAGNTDQIYFYSLDDLTKQTVLGGSKSNLLKKVIELRIKNNPKEALNSLFMFDQQLKSISTLMLPNSRKDGMSRGADMIDQFFDRGRKGLFSSIDNANLTKTITDRFEGVANMYAAKVYLTNELKENQSRGNAKYPLAEVQRIIEELSKLDELVSLFEYGGDFGQPDWSTVDLKDAMEFVRDENNTLPGMEVNFFPSKKFRLTVNKENALSAGTISEKQLKTCPEFIEFTYNSKNYLTKSEIMMLDILSNNNWERGIYFSSNRGSDLAIALLQAGYIKQIGVAFELSPIRGVYNPTYRFYSMIDVEKMEKNMTEIYQYGDIKNPKVLSDYYARRHISQYRQCFVLLAQEYFYSGNLISDSIRIAEKKFQADTAKIIKENRALTEDVKKYLASLENDLENVLAPLRKNRKENFHRAERILDQCQELMPIDHVIDFGEVGRMDPLSTLGINTQHSYYDEKRNIPALSSGHGHEMVQLYSMIDSEQKAIELANKLIEDYSSIFNFFRESAPSLAANAENAEDIHAALDACFKMQVTAEEYESDDLANKMKLFIEETYDHVIDPLLGKMGNLDKNGGFETRVKLMRKHYWNETSSEELVNDLNMEP